MGNSELINCRHSTSVDTRNAVQNVCIDMKKENLHQINNSKNTRGNILDSIFTNIEINKINWFKVFYFT